MRLVSLTLQVRLDTVTVIEDIPYERSILCRYLTLEAEASGTDVPKGPLAWIASLPFFGSSDCSTY